MKRYGLVLGWLLVVSTVAWGQIGGYSQVGPEQPGLLNAIELMASPPPAPEPEFGSPEWFEGLRQGHISFAPPPVNPVQPNPASHAQALGRLSALMQVGGFPPSSLAAVGLLPDARFGASLHFVGQPSPGTVGTTPAGPGHIPFQAQTLQ